MKSVTALTAAGQQIETPEPPRDASTRILADAETFLLGAGWEAMSPADRRTSWEVSARRYLAWQAGTAEPEVREAFEGPAGPVVLALLQRMTDDVRRDLAVERQVLPVRAMAELLKQVEARMVAAQAPKLLFSIREAAAYLGIGPSKFKEDVQPELPRVLIGDRVLFEKKDLDAWAREHKVAGSSDSPKVGAVARTSSGSGTLVSGSNGARAKQILAELQSKPRGSTRT